MNVKYAKDLKVGDRILLPGSPALTVTYRWLYSESYQKQSLLTSDGLERQFPGLHPVQII